MAKIDSHKTTFKQLNQKLDLLEKESIQRGEDFLAFGYELTDTRLGARFVKYADKVCSD